MKVKFGLGGSRSKLRKASIRVGGLNEVARARYGSIENTQEGIYGFEKEVGEILCMEDLRGMIAED